MIVKNFEQDDANATTKTKTIDDPRDTSTNRPTTLLELIQSVLMTFDDDRLRELRFAILMNDSYKKFVSRVEFEQSLEQAQDNSVETLFLGPSNYDQEFVDLGYRNIQALLYTPDLLVQRINNVAGKFNDGDKQVLPWDKNLVVPFGGSDLNRIAFCSDSSKGSAIVVSGESGSGKTWFAQKYIPNKLGTQDLALIYCSIQDDDEYDRIKSDNTLKNQRMACEKGMRYLYDEKRSNCKVYECLSNLSMEYNKERDTLAYRWLKDKITSALDDDDLAKEWWNSNATSKLQLKPIEKLVLVVDEVGKNPELARALVSIVRKLYQDIIRSNKANQVLLVLVGSGLDRHIRSDSGPYFAGDATQTTSSSFGTDPLKSNIIILKGPDLTAKTDPPVLGIPSTCLLRGTYSRILSTNTRMLTRGVLPMMKIPELTAYVSPDKLSARYVALGSTNIVMDYAARNYLVMNGVGRLKLDSIERQTALLRQFKLLLWERLMHIKDSNPAAAKILGDLDVKMPSDLDETLALGLVTSDINTTSPALRYLACNGYTAPLDAQDGIGFEIMLQYHLVRLCEAYSSRQSDSRKSRATHWVGRCDLRQAWPPFSAKGKSELSDFTVTQDTVEQRYSTSNNGDADDIGSIMDLLEDKDYFDLVMRQTVSNAQGADLMILSRKDAEVALHLFQCKNLKTIPGVNSKQVWESFESLGVERREGRVENISVEPDCGSAGYSYLGTQHFAKKLGEKLGTEVKIGHRILVFSKEWEGEWDDQNGGTNVLKKAFEKGVMVWTREMLEPTVSALYTTPADSRNSM
jgi:hypothetical protein